MRYPPSCQDRRANPCSLISLLSSQKRSKQNTRVKRLLILSSRRRRSCAIGASLSKKKSDDDDDDDATASTSPPVLGRSLVALGGALKVTEVKNQNRGAKKTAKDSKDLHYDFYTNPGVRFLGDIQRVRGEAQVRAERKFAVFHARRPFGRASTGCGSLGGGGDEGELSPEQQHYVLAAFVALASGGAFPLCTCSSTKPSSTSTKPETASGAPSRRCPWGCIPELASAWFQPTLETEM
jgi:hypothetical protein